MEKRKQSIGKIFLSVAVVMLIAMSCFACDLFDKKETETDNAVCEHTYGEWEIITEATCNQIGEREKTCSKCSNVVTEEIPLTDHTYDGEGTVTQKPVCGKSDGERQFTCTVCGYVKTETIAKADAHSWERLENAVSATCTAEGKTEKKECSVCGTVEGGETVKKLAHSLTHTDRKEATCTADGNIEYWECSSCKKCFSDKNGKTEISVVVLSATGHNISHVDAVTGVSDCDPRGTKEHYHCDRCGYNFEDAEGKVAMPDISTKVGSHDLVHHEKLITCLSEGYEEYWQCTKCECCFLTEEATAFVEYDTAIKIAKQDHKYIDIAAKTAYCGENGGIGCVAHKECEYCKKCLTTDGEETTAEAVATFAPHDPEFVAAESATCEHAGILTHYQCSVCQKLLIESGGGFAEVTEEELVNSEDPKKSHSAVLVENTTGCIYQYYLCTLCNQLFSDSACENNCTEDFTAQHSQTLTKYKEAVAETCSVNGQEEIWYCSGCDKYYYDEAGLKAVRYENDFATASNIDLACVIPATGHLWQLHPAKVATCTAKGNKEYHQCVSCHKFYVESDTENIFTEDALTAKTETQKDHDYEEVATVPATCTTVGYEANEQCADCKAWKNERVEIPMLAHEYDSVGVCKNCEHQLSYTVEFKDESFDKDYTVTYGKDFVLPLSTLSMGTFIGWTVQSGSSAILITNNKGESILPWSTLTAYVANGDTKEQLGSYVMTWAEEGEQTVVTALSKGTSTFYKVLAQKLGASESDVRIQEGATVKIQVTALWTTDPITIVYNTTTTPEGATLEKANTNPTVISKTTKFTPAPLTLSDSGYSFDGWISSNVSYSQVNGLSSQATFTARWKANSYTVTYVTNNNSVNKGDETVEYKKEITLDNTLTADRKTFIGWFFDDKFTSPCGEKITMPANDITLYAKWNNFAFDESSFVYTVTQKNLKAEDLQNNIISDAKVKELFAPSVKDILGNDLTACTYAGIVTGSVKGGEQVTVEITVEFNKVSKTFMLTEDGIAASFSVYEKPTLTRAEDTAEKAYSTLDYFSVDGDFNAAWWGYTATDSFKQSIDTVEVFVGELDEGVYKKVETYEGGDYVTVVIRATDVAGNVAEKIIENVKVYSAPTITYTELKAVKVDNAGTLYDIDAGTVKFDKLITALSMNAKDLFSGTDLTVTCTLAEGSFDPVYTARAGDKLIVTCRAQDADKRGKEAEVTVTVKILGTPVYKGAKLNFNVDDEITAESTGVLIEDSCGDKITTGITVTLKSGQVKEAGNTCLYTVTASDDAGNAFSQDIEIRYYGTPTIAVYDEFPDGDNAGVLAGTYKAISVDTALTAEEMGVLATDSFGKSINVAFTVQQWKRTVDEEEKIFTTAEDGEYTSQSGDKVQYRIAVTDKLGNTATLDQWYKIYDVNAITFTCNPIEESNRYMKLSSCGEEFNIGATGSFGSCTISAWKKVDGERLPLVAGEEADVVFVATDAAGNQKEFETVIENVKIYGTPTFRYTKHTELYLLTDEDLVGAFTVRDSFGEIVSITTSTVTDATPAEITDLHIDGLTAAKKVCVESSEDNAGNVYNGTVYIPVITRTVDEENDENSVRQSILNMEVNGEIVASYVVTKGVEKTGIVYQFTGLTFGGWSYNGADLPFDGENPDKLTWTEDTGVYTLVAKLSGTVYTATYTENEQEIVYKVQYGTKNVTKDDVACDGFGIPTVEDGYRFIGWTVDNVLITDEEGKLLDNWAYAENKDLTAKTALIYTLKYTVNGLEKTKEVCDGDEYQLEPATEIGKVFGGWQMGSAQLTDDEGKSLTPWSESDADQIEITLSAYFSLVKSSLNVYYGDEFLGTVVATYGEDYILPLKGTGYNFSGWYADIDNIATQITGVDGKCLKKWNQTGEEYRVYTLNPGVLTYKVTYYNEGALYQEDEYTVETVNELTMPVLTKETKVEVTQKMQYSGANRGKFLVTTVSTVYTFAGWYTDSKFTQRINKITIENTNVTLYSKWTENVNTVKENKTFLLDEDEKGLRMGAYPQTRITNEAVIATLNSKKSRNINAAEWTSYSYYNNGSQEVEMYYIDYYDEENDVLYRGVDIGGYRMQNAASGTTTNQDDHDYLKGQVYWFRYEEVHWTIMKNVGSYTLVCDNILDSQNYDLQASPTNIYDNSTLKVWLSSMETVLFQSAISDILSFELLTETDLTNYTNLVLKKKATDYAVCQNLYIDGNGNGSWWLKTETAGSKPTEASYVSYQGSTATAEVTKTYIGIVLKVTVSTEE